MNGHYKLAVALETQCSIPPTCKIFLSLRFTNLSRCLLGFSHSYSFSDPYLSPQDPLNRQGFTFIHSCRRGLSPFISLVRTFVSVYLYNTRPLSFTYPLNPHSFLNMNDLVRRKRQADALNLCHKIEEAALDQDHRQSKLWRF